MKNNKKWIFFDLDDTIIPSTEAYEHAYRKLQLTTDSVFYFAKKYVKNTLPLNHTSSHNRFLYFKKFLELKGELSPKKLILLNTKYESYLINYLQNHNKKSSLNKDLKHLKKSYNLAIVTNENCRTQILKINSIDPLGNIFDKIITSEDVGHEKPHLNIFKEALKVCDTKSKNVIFIGDNYKNDYVPAKKIGMRAVLMTAFNDESVNRNKSLEKISSLDDIKNL